MDDVQDIAVLVAALYSAGADAGELDDGRILAELADTAPLWPNGSTPCATGPGSAASGWSDYRFAGGPGAGEHGAC